MSGRLSDFLIEPTTAVFEPSADIFICELFTNVFVLISVESWIASNADHDAGEVRAVAGVWRHDKNSAYFNESKETKGSECVEMTHMLRRIWDDRRRSRRNVARLAQSFRQ